jgi:N-acetylglucosaminyl-diphospho-decaprenol L-rhamnosyltransferase
VSGQATGAQRPGVLDVVVVAYHSAADLPACLDSIAAEGSGVVGQVLVVDNSADPEALEAARRVVAARPGDRLLDPGVNAGFGAGANRGVAATARSGAPYAAILNPDTVIAPGALGRLVRELEARPALAAVGPQVRSLDGSIYPSARTFPSLVVAAGHALLGQLRPGNPFTRRYVGAGQPDWISGTAMVVRRTAFEAIGGFDEGYFMYVEDVDLCWRWRQAGWTVDRVDDAVVHHAIGRSSERAPFAMIAAHHRSLWRFARRSTRGPARAALPLVAIGLVARAAMVALRRTVHHAPPAAAHSPEQVGARTEAPPPPG